MRFNNEAYGKLFPPKKEVAPVESMVDTFKPTEEIEQHIAEVDAPAVSTENVETEVERNGSERVSQFDNE